MLVDFRRIPVRADIDPDPPRLFKGYQRIVERPEDYKNFAETVSSTRKSSAAPRHQTGSENSIGGDLYDFTGRRNWF